MLKFSVQNLLFEHEDIRVVLSSEERARIRKIILGRFDSFKDFSDSVGMPYDTFHNWIKINDKRRQPGFSDYSRIVRALGVGFAPFSELQCNNSLRRISSLPKEVVVDENFMLCFGLFAAEGDKKTAKRVSFTNCSPEAVKFFINFLTGYLGCSKESMHLYVYLPPNSAHPYEDYSLVFGFEADKTRYYCNPKSSSPCFIVSACDCFAKKIFDSVQEVLREKPWPTNLARAFLSGVLAGDGSVSFSPERKYYEVCIAVGFDEAVLVRKALDVLEITYTERKHSRSPLCLIKVHKKSNFIRLLGAGGFAFSDAKNKKLRQAISNYTFSR